MLTVVERKKRVREALVIVLAILLIVLLTGVEIRLTQISSKAPLSSNVVIFGMINVIVLLVVLLVYLISRNIVKLLIESRASVLATRLRTKLVISFVGLSLVPTMLLFFASASFITNSIQNWFNVQVETSLSESLEVAQTYYKTSASNALFYARRLSETIKRERLLNDDSLPRMKSVVRDKQKEYNLGIVEVFSSQREELIRASNPDVPLGDLTSPNSEDINQALAGRELTKVNSVGKADLIRGIVPIYSTYNDRDVVGVVVVNYYVSHSLVSKMREISSAYQEFRRLKILKNPITTGYLLVLFLIASVIVFLSFWIGIYLANSMTKPIQSLVEGTRAVAEGDLEVVIDAEGPDEIGMLVRSFNTMILDLRTQRQVLSSTNEELKHINQEIESRRRYMEIVLRNVAAGVISVDREGLITTINTSAERLLHINIAHVLGRNFREVMREAHLEIVRDALRDMALTRHDTISRQITLEMRGERRVLQMNLTMLRDEQGEFLGSVLVLDDLTQMVKGQRMAAWREVARRIAHEIKNPLTPIQLSAQRLRKRYLERFSGDEDGRVFDECTSMISKAVDELKILVNEFSNFARMPAVQPTENNLNDLVRETLTLYQEAHREVRFQFAPDLHLPAIKIDRDQIKRVLINLLENAVAAMANKGTVAISTTYDPELKMVSCCVADDGPGMSAEVKSRLFEPYFSTKKGGTGLGLAIVTSIVSDHNGFVRVRDNSPHGACFVVELPAT
ncbi:HAMP domain-containing protein [Trichlorobacter lovleyi]|uniref:sensor histidine kinase n=1 Tax=Trichlorobacter lovleyi TaxID=313985 RepID=UPI00223FD3B3|nr:ATP-binding protein [Trichlorobacter lovleyi]QOX78476.1 HAMP domain-containing protein [Trichlorobacter lovleyi]